MKLSNMRLKNTFIGIGMILCFHVAGQNIGVNTYLPETDVHIVTQQKQKGGMLMEGSDSTKVVGLILQNNMANGRGYAIQSIGGSADSLDGKLMIIDRTANTKRFVIDSTGKVGIGMLDPQTQLHVKGAIQTDNSLISNQVFSENLVIQGPSILNGQLTGTNAFFTGEITALQGNILGDISAIGGNFATEVSANSGDFNSIVANTGTFSHDISARNVHLDENISADSAVLNHLVLNEDLELEDGSFSGYLSVGKGLYVDSFLNINSGHLFVNGQIETNDAFRYGNTQINTHHISAPDFSAEGPFSVNPWIHKENYRYLFQAGPDSIIVSAPLNLPDSAVIRSMTVYYYDNSQPHHIFDSFISLKMLPKVGGIIPDTLDSGMFSTTSNDTDSEIRHMSFTAPPNQIAIDNKSNMYYLQVALNLSNSNANEAIRFYGVSIEYQIFSERGI
jgi:hypothetical protein